MSITKELRHNIEGAEQLYGCECKHLLAIADRIDAAVEGMVELPKDADDVPWKVGDRDEDGNVVTELRLTYDGCWFVITDGEWPYRPKRKRHHHDHHTPNVEDVLRQVIACANNGTHVHGALDTEQIVAEYAAKLRLAEGEDE